MFTIEIINIVLSYGIIHTRISTLRNIIITTTNSRDMAHMPKVRPGTCINEIRTNMVSSIIDVHKEDSSSDDISFK